MFEIVSLCLSSIAVIIIALIIFKLPSKDGISSEELHDTIALHYLDMLKEFKHISNEIKSPATIKGIEWKYCKAHKWNGFKDGKLICSFGRRKNCCGDKRKYWHLHTSKGKVYLSSYEDIPLDHLTDIILSKIELAEIPCNCDNCNGECLNKK